MRDSAAHGRRPTRSRDSTPYPPSIMLECKSLPTSFVFKLSLATVASVAGTLKIFRIEEEGLIVVVHRDILLCANLVICICRRTRAIADHRENTERITGK